MKKSTLCLVLLVAFVPVVAFASTNEEIFSAFKNKSEPINPSIIVPTVAEVKINNQKIDRSIFAAFDKTDNAFVNSLFMENYVAPKMPSSISIGDQVDLINLHDNNYGTFSEFELPATGSGHRALDIKYDVSITTDNLEIALDQYVSLPTEVSIYSYNQSGDKQIILNKIKPDSSYINFPKITTNRLKVDLTYSQPLRIVEVYFSDLDTKKDFNSSLRFLAEPNHQYEILLNPDRNVNIPLGESPNLSLDEGVKQLGLVNVIENSAYVQSDVDGDGVVDEIDNCVRNSNSDQADIDNNGRGDVCDDFDKDGVINQSDNCINKPNRDQSDIDNDKMGDSCDPDESRITEKYPILVWGGIIFAVLIFVALYFASIKSIRKPE